MKVFTLLVSILIAASMSAQSSQPMQIGPVHSSGAFASMNSCCASGVPQIQLIVTRSDNSSLKTTFLQVDIFSFEPDSFTDVFAFGEIPNDALKGDNTKHMNLSIDTGQLSSFQTKSCTFNFVDFTETCQSGPFGLIQLDFQQNGSRTLRTVSDVHETFPQFEVHSQRNANSAIASVNGSVLGIPISNAFGELGTNRDTGITLTSTH